MQLFDQYDLDTTEFLGYIGGLLLALNLMPQFVKSIRERSTKDISYSWQMIYLIGLWLNLGYVLLINAVAAWMTLIVEMFVAHALFFLKIYYDGCKCEEPCFSLSIDDDSDVDYDNEDRNDTEKRSDDEFYFDEAYPLYDDSSNAEDTPHDNTLPADTLHNIVWAGQTLDSGNQHSLNRDSDFGNSRKIEMEKSICDSDLYSAAAMPTTLARTSTNGSAASASSSISCNSIKKNLLQDVCRRGYHYAIDASFDEKHRISLAFGRKLMGVILDAADKYKVRVIHSTLETFVDEDYGPFEFSPSCSGFAITIITSDSQIIAHCNTGSIVDEEDAQLEQNENDDSNGRSRPALNAIGTPMHDNSDECYGSLALDCFIRGGDGSDRGASISSATSSEAGCRLIMESVLEFLYETLGRSANIHFFHIQRFRSVLRMSNNSNTNNLLSGFSNHSLFGNSNHSKVGFNNPTPNIFQKQMQNSSGNGTAASSMMGTNNSGTKTTGNIFQKQMQNNAARGSGGSRGANSSGGKTTGNIFQKQKQHTHVRRSDPIDLEFGTVHSQSSLGDILEEVFDDDSDTMHA